MKLETKNEIIQKRLSIIAPLLNRNGRDRIELLERIAIDQDISTRTIRRYLKAYEENGLSGLCPKYRDSKQFNTRYARFNELIEYCKALKRADHAISINKIIEATESAYINCKGILKRSTVQRWLQKDGLDRKQLRIADGLRERQVYARYRKSHRLEQVQCDYKEFPRGVFIDENGCPCKVYLQVCIDNFSKMVLSYSVTTNQKVYPFIGCLKSLIKAYGVPKTLLMDNGSAYKNAIITRACECLGIKAKYCKPYSPETKGVIERFNYTINDIENQLKHFKNVSIDGAIEICRARINEYNDSPHSGLDGKSPRAVFFSDQSPLNHIPDETTLDFAFKKLIKRAVAKDGTISYEGKKYVVDMEYIAVGKDALLLTDGANLEQIISDNKTKPIFLQEIKENISKNTWKQINGKGDDELGFNLTDYGYITKLLREQNKKDGKYINEETFLKDIEKLLYKQTTKQEHTIEDTSSISPLTKLTKFKDTL